MTEESRYGLLCRYLLEGEGRNVDTFARVLDGDATDLAFSINVQNIVLVDLSGHPNPANDGHLKTGQR